MQPPKILLATAIFATLTACGGAGSDTLPTDKDLAVQNQPLPAAPKVPLRKNKPPLPPKKYSPSRAITV